MYKIDKIIHKIGDYTELFINCSFYSEFMATQLFSLQIKAGLCSGNTVPEHTGTEQEIRCSGTIFQTEKRSPFRSGTKLLFRDRNKRNGTRNSKKFDDIVLYFYEFLSAFLII